MKTLPKINDIRNLLKTEIASAIGESEYSVSLQINEFSKNDETYSATGTFQVAPVLFVTRSGKFTADIAQTDGGLRITKLKMHGAEE